ncbi:MAG: single-stranded-DNA-specific exonuclease RecJ [Bacteroidia bacterium]|nr:single-stranded-DNA-specific exonuclease RecJ [Bacteroidia bacterium]
MDVAIKLKSGANQEIVAELAKGLQIDAYTAKVLAQRGIDTVEKAYRFFNPSWDELHDPYLMEDMDKAVQRILQAFKNQEKIVVYGDYDVDGTTAVAIVSLFLDHYHQPYEYYLPDRNKEGYGLSVQGIDYTAECGATVLITLDCGIKSVDMVQYAKSKGIDTIICDHHLPGPELPPAVAILDPKKQSCQYPCKDLTGCGIGFKLVQALIPEVQKLRPELPLFQLQDYSDLITLSIACDIVPITNENRIFAYHGLKKLRENPMIGIRQLMNYSKKERDWSISDIVFFLGPRINAAGRLKHAKDAVAVLMGKSAFLEELAQELEYTNEKRREEERKIVEGAYELIRTDTNFHEKNSIVLYSPDWNKGVIGIVASKLVETYYKPTVLLTKSEPYIVGSCRSVHDFDMYEALEQCQDYLVQFGGHKFAAGLTLQEEQLEKFLIHFEKFCDENLKQHQKKPVQDVDAEISFTFLTPKFVRLQNQMEPFGPENMRPVFMARNVRIKNVKILYEKNIRAILQQGNKEFEAIGYNIAGKYAKILEQSRYKSVNVMFYPTFKSKNSDEIILHIKAFSMPL